MSAGRCQACGAESAPEAAFCQHCGHRIGARPAAEPHPAQADKMRADTMRAATTRAATMRAERKVVTVLFADVTGSLGLIAGQDPEQVDDILASVIETMRRAVHRFGGTVSQTLGDGIMALFGAPRAIEDHAVQACLAALAMRATLRSQGNPRLSIRTGLNSGEVVVRAMRDDVTARYGAVGEPVHLAARMEQAAAPDQILIAAETRRLAGERIEVRALGSTPIRGLEDGQEIFELTGAAPRRATGQPRPPGRSARLVGREADLALMQLARDAAVAGRGRVVRVIGDAGCGKSRLLREFLGGLPAAEWLVCQGDAVPHRQMSYGTFIAMVTDLLGFELADSLDTRRGKLWSHLAELDGADAGRFGQPLASLLDLGVDDPDWHVIEPWERRERTGQAVCELFLRASRGARSAALVIEDAHWLDAESAGLFERLAALSAGERLLTIVTERAEQKLNWGVTQAWTECHLRPLDEAASRRLVREHLLPGPGVAGLEERLIEHTRGNPLFIEECLYALAESGELAQTEDGRFRLVAPVQALRVPRSLRGLLDARVDRLPDGDKDVLQAASVVGITVPADLLRSVAGLDEEALRPALDRLCHDGFLLPESGDGSRFAFRHGLTREAVYNSILKRTRRRMHAGAFAALENHPAGLTDAADLLADHAFRAEVWPKAVEYARQAGSKAAGHDANSEAVRAYEQALTAASHLPQSASRDRILLDLHLEARAPLFRLGDVAGLAAHIDDAIALAERQGDHGRLAQCTIFRSHALWLAGDSAGAMASAQTAQAMAEATSDRDLGVRARFQAGLVHLSQSHPAEIIAAMRHVLAHIADADHACRYGLDDALAVTSLSYLARAAADAGDFVTAAAAVADARRRAQLLDKSFTWIFAEMAEGYLLLMQGHAGRASEPLERAMKRCQAANARLLGPVPASLLALARVEAGEPAQGLALARQAVGDAVRMGFLALQPMRLAILARALLAAGSVEEAAIRAEEARALAHRLGESGAEAYALRQIAAVGLREGRIDDARAALQTASRLAAALGLVPLASDCNRLL